MEYLSTAKEFLRQATSNIVLWSKDDVWYNKIRTAMTARIVKRCIDNWMAISDKAAPLPRPDMITVTKYLAKKGDAASISDRLYLGGKTVPLLKQLFKNPSLASERKVANSCSTSMIKSG